MALQAPARQVAPLLALAAASLALDAAPKVPWAAGAAGAGLFAAAAAVRRGQVAVSQRSARRVADHRILRGQGVPVWREEELVSTRARNARRREVDRLIRAASANRLPSASPLNRVAVRANASLLRSLAGRLAGDVPVSARGMLYVDQLLRDPSSPLFGGPDELLPRAIARVIGALDE